MMQIPIDWKKVTDVFLDMDGTLLDLYFDNYFWHEHVPLRYSEKNKIDIDLAKQKLKSQYDSKAGTLDWYCIDYWSRELELDITSLKQEVTHRLKIFPNVKLFLEKLRNHGKRTILVTNAHRNSVAIKMNYLELHNYFDKVISSHDYGYPKEKLTFWEYMMRAEPFEPESTLFIDDNTNVLAVAEAYGIHHLVTIKQPDSKRPHQDTLHYHAITDFSEIMPE